MKYQVKKCKGGWYWRIVANNHKVLAHSETYSRRRDAVKTMMSVKSRSMYCTSEIEQGRGK